MLTVIFGFVAAIPCILFPARSKSLSVSAAENVAVTPLSLENSQLFLPGSYEQYLEFVSPVDIAVCERYIAIAEQQKIYIFDREEAEPTYHIFTHSRTISKIQFASGNMLYFMDSTSPTSIPLRHPICMLPSRPF